MSSLTHKNIDEDIFCRKNRKSISSWFYLFFCDKRSCCCFNSVDFLEEQGLYQRLLLYDICLIFVEINLIYCWLWRFFGLFYSVSLSNDLFLLVTRSRFCLKCACVFCLSYHLQIGFTFSCVLIGCVYFLFWLFYFFVVIVAHFLLFVFLLTQSLLPHSP